MEGTRRKWRALFCSSQQVNFTANNASQIKDNLFYNLLSNPWTKSLFLHGMYYFLALNSLLIMGLKLLITDNSLHFRLFSAHSFNCSRPRQYRYMVSLNGLKRHLPPQHTHTQCSFLHGSLRTITHTKKINETQKPNFQLVVLSQQCLDFRIQKNQHLQNGKLERVHISYKARYFSLEKKWHLPLENSNGYNMV